MKILIYFVSVLRLNQEFFTYTTPASVGGNQAVLGGNARSSAGSCQTPRTGLELTTIATDCHIMED